MLHLHSSVTVASPHVTARHLASFLARDRAKMQVDDQQNVAKDIESEIQIVDSPDALVLSSDPNHVRPRSRPYAEATINNHHSQQISFLNSVKLSTIWVGSQGRVGAYRFGKGTVHVLPLSLGQNA